MMVATSPPASETLIRLARPDWLKQVLVIKTIQQASQAIIEKYEHIRIRRVRIQTNTRSAVFVTNNALCANYNEYSTNMNTNNIGQLSLFVFGEY
jgi:hypothetical protein